jgi:hypothetical protein
MGPRRDAISAAALNGRLGADMGCYCCVAVAMRAGEGTIESGG